MSDRVSITFCSIHEYPEKDVQAADERAMDLTSRQANSTCAGIRCESPMANSAEVMQLHVRVIALENLVIALLSEATERQLDLARGMASYIAPRPEATQHPLTKKAAAQIQHFVDRSTQFRPL